MLVALQKYSRFDCFLEFLSFASCFLKAAYVCAPPSVYWFPQVQQSENMCLRSLCVSDFKYAWFIERMRGASRYTSYFELVVISLTRVRDLS